MANPILFINLQLLFFNYHRPSVSIASNPELAYPIYRKSSSSVLAHLSKSFPGSGASSSSPQWALGRFRFFSSLPPHSELSMPALSPTMSQGNIIEWKVTEGQEVAPGDVLAEVETDKATISWENQDDGFIAKLLVPPGTQGIDIGTPVAILVEDAESVPAFKDYTSGGGAAASTSAASTATAETTTAPAQSSVEIDSRLGPAARHHLQESGIAISSVHPTGPHHMVTKGDVLAAIAAGGSSGSGAASSASKPAAAAPAAPKAAEAAPQAAAAPAAAPAPVQAPSSSSSFDDEDGGYTDIPTTQIRRIIAQRLLESKSTIPHLYLSADVELDGIATMRDALKSQGVKVSVNDCVIKAVALALAEVPAANAKWDTVEEKLVASPSVDISIAVATPGGLITPIVKNADGKSLSTIAGEVRDLAGRARENKLKPEEFQGGSFSISNLGMFGVDQFYAIINPPQACIMAVGGARKVAKMQNGAPTSTTMMTVTLSADNRVYDGEVASKLLEEFAKNMANPYRLCLGSA
jgi:pyruvate dehydrogenase E2 component (dihydrolipoamide acetyltransferase)